MSFVVNTVVEPNEVVDILVAKLLGNTELLVIAKRNSIELYSFELENKVELQNSFDINEHILDVRLIKLFDDKEFLVLATASNKLLIIGFNSLSEGFVLEEIKLKDDEVYLTIQQGTLGIDPSNQYIVVFTNEGLLVTYELDQKVSKLNLNTYLHQKKKKKQLFKKPIVSSFPKHKRETRDPMLVERLVLLNDREYSYISVLYRDDLFQYYLKTYSKENNKLDFWNKLKLPDTIKPNVVLPVHELGTFMMSKNGVILSIAPYWSRSSFLDDKNQNSTIHIVNDDQQTYIQKKLPMGSTWEIKSATIIPTNDNDDSIKFILVTETGEYYISVFKAAKDTITGELYVDSWTLHKLEGQFPESPSIIKLLNNSNQFIIKNSSSIEIKQLHSDFSKFNTSQSWNITSSILDFNISGTTLPKIQICGGSDLHTGFIKTEFNGFETSLTSIFDNFNEIQGVLNIWHIDDKILINTLEGIHIFEKKFGGYHKFSNDFYGLTNINGNIIDLGFTQGKLIVITDQGIFQNGKQIQKLNISTGKILNNLIPIYVSGSNLYYKNEKYPVTDDVSVLNIFQDNKTIHILIGHWDGSIEIFINGIKKTFKKSNMAINSVLIKKIGSNLNYIVGDVEGNIKIMNLTDTISILNIGDAPVTIVDYESNSILVYNVENLIKIEFDNETGDLSNRGYLNVESPLYLNYYPELDQIWGVNDKGLYQISMENSSKLLTDDTKLNKLVRKSINFKNFLHLSLFLINGTTINPKTNEETWNCELHVIDNNNYQTKCIYKFPPGIEITDVVNTQYHKELIDTYEEEPIGLAMENIFSQCFIVSCSYTNQDDIGPSLMLFSVDEFGQLQYQCSSPKNQKYSFQSLTNHGNRIIIGVGDSIVGYKLDYSITDSKFSLKKITDVYKTRYFTSHIKSCGSEIVVGDLIHGVSKLSLKVKPNRLDEEDMIFQFEESLQNLEQVHFLTGLETWGNLIITSDSLRNIKIQFANGDECLLISEFNLDDQINCIRFINKDKTVMDKINQVLMSGSMNNELDDIITLFVLGSINGGVYLISIVLAEDLSKILKDSQDLIIKSKHDNLIINDTSSDGKLIGFEQFKSVKGTRQTLDHSSIGFIDGDLIKKYDDDISGNLVKSKCVLL
ncbi:hypothetical protein BN7_3174 [Wickerhamomyces ciferrii]|uniref:Uncharacterized protein n=1 Tax=Wickerhamomyces ciferrii (strain ATCC 14091 / BCRC 22168 / CBS 111 / JCM 3599 / NBRC 0793 / NRRL Y-1031 F-60-10) TaxID=1206466 RepID=K0KKT4_WICCF|nr:uncharacterized protein BN7_3174 [Wickerhamomyces ciferrii]CCH43621.1 hypothetical protein BN7_3174 [Wickerhamomyces ciferrii]